MKTEYYSKKLTDNHFLEVEIIKFLYIVKDLHVNFKRLLTYSLNSGNEQSENMKPAFDVNINGFERKCNKTIFGSQNVHKNTIIINPEESTGEQTDI